MELNPRQPVRPNSDVPSLVRAMSMTGFQGRKLGESARVWSEMIQDPDCTIILGLSGAMVPAGMQECLIELIAHRYVDAIVSTGANIFHDIAEHLSIHHYLGHHCVDDAALYDKGIDRIYDVFAYETEFRSVDFRVAAFAESLAPYHASSADFIRRLAGHITDLAPDGRSFTATAVQAGVPIFVPALCDSSLGIALTVARRRGAEVAIDQIADADELTAIVEGARKTGVVYVGGGVPKNFIQQTQVIASMHDNELGGHAYAVQYTSDAPHWGGLSGCTFEEAISWGKESPETRSVQCFCDATIALPIVTSALLGSGLVRARPGQG
ncbi:deoxyhypusine synthase [Methanofollis formosanus]|uniref:Deoxyhypusine synthase n=1 Tax=Methanofollis formosanus TaxID=299308 RepID=A0A8G1A3E1_9EURY|nr:deoxyhypusine synthase [Methanofollis formosanus]QYZ79706.1 deoxyhypusine synthase [Methanofollis formosanus]